MKNKLSTEGCINLSAELIKQSIPDKVPYICANNEIKRKLERMCKININFAKKSKLISMYCGTMNWDEKRMRQRILDVNKKLLRRLVVGKKKKPCEYCKKPTLRKGEQQGIKELFFCSPECENKYLESSCLAQGCGQPIFKKGLCKKHYKMWFA